MLTHYGDPKRCYCTAGVGPPWCVYMAIIHIRSNHVGHNVMNSHNLWSMLNEKRKSVVLFEWYFVESNICCVDREWNVKKHSLVQANFPTRGARFVEKWLIGTKIHSNKMTCVISYKAELCNATHIEGKAEMAVLKLSCLYILSNTLTFVKVSLCDYLIIKKENWKFWGEPSMARRLFCAWSQRLTMWIKGQGMCLFENLKKTNKQTKQTNNSRRTST